VGDDRSLKNLTIIIKCENILQLSAMATLIPASPVLAHLFTNGYNEYPFPNEILKLIRDGAKHSQEISLAAGTEHNNILHYHQRILVRDYKRLKHHIVQQHHNVLAAGHPGRSRTLEYLCRKYTWPKMRTDVDCYTHNCDTYYRMKSSEHAPYLLQIDPGRTYQWIL
jgi:hypothetical protein